MYIWVPLPCVWKIDPQFLRSGKKCGSPPPPPPYQTFPDLRDFEAGGGPMKKKHGLVRIDAHGTDYT